MKNKKVTKPIDTILKNKSIGLYELFKILEGIDKDGKNGWWDDELGAQFGNNILVQIVNKSEYK